MIKESKMKDFKTNGLKVLQDNEFTERHHNIKDNI